MRLRNIIIFNIISIIFAFNNNNYSKLTRLTYKPLQESSEINLQVALYNDSNPLFGVQWWVSNNLQLSGSICPKINNEFNLYNNFAIGYYNENIKWLYSSSNFIELSLHRIKYNNNYSPKWINFAYKSRYNYKNFILGYDVNHCFWKNMENNFISLIIAYNINRKIIFEFKIDLISESFYINSFNFLIPL